MSTNMINIFLESFIKTANKEVSTVACFNGDKALWGKRRDNDSWTTAGGHLDPGEDPLDGAKRELMEEAGLEGTNWKHIETKKVTTPKGEKLTVYGYKCDSVGTETSMKNDPDQEVYRWHWMKGIPKGKLHVPLENNVLLKAFEKSASRVLKHLQGYKPNPAIEYVKAFHDRHTKGQKKEAASFSNNNRLLARKIADRIGNPGAHMYYRNMFNEFDRVLGKHARKSKLNVIRSTRK